MMFGYEPTRRSDWDKYGYGGGDLEHYEYKGMGMGDKSYKYGGKSHEDEYKRHKLMKKLAKMDEKERKMYMKHHHLGKGYGEHYSPEFERKYYKPHYETYVEEHPYYRYKDYPKHEKYGFEKYGKEDKYGKEGKHGMEGMWGKEEMWGKRHGMHGMEEMYSPKYMRKGYEMEKYHTMGGIECKLDKKGRKKWKAICDMGESEKYWIVRAELPGVRKEKLKVEMEGKDLIIIGKKKKELWHMDKLGIKHKEKEKEKEGMKKGEEKKEGMAEKMKEKVKEGIGMKEGKKEGKMKEDEFKGKIKWWRKERGMKRHFQEKNSLTEES